jgi:hypothetical protein
MAILGKFDNKALANVGVTNGDATVTTASNFLTTNKIDPGDIIEIANVAYLVKQVTSSTSLELHKAYTGSTSASVSAKRRTAPKAVAEYVIKGGDSLSYDLVFADANESTISTNKSRGIWGPGWWLYHTYTDADGNTRHKAECLAPLTVAFAVSGDDTDDQIVADLEATINVGTTVPFDTTINRGQIAYFNISYSITGGGSPVIQWQRKKTATGSRWVNITTGNQDSADDISTYNGFTSTQLQVITTGASNDASGYQYRAKVTTTAGAEEQITRVATLTIN